MIAIEPRMTWVAFVLVSAIGLVAAGCGRSSSSGQYSGPPEGGGQGAGGPGGPRAPSSEDVLAKLPGGDEFAAGKRVYAEQQLYPLSQTRRHRRRAACTERRPSGGREGSRSWRQRTARRHGRSRLTMVGADAKHTKSGLRNTSAIPRPTLLSRARPASGPEKIGDADLDALAAYLASRK